MNIFTLNSENSDYQNLLEQLGSFSNIELFEDIDFLVETIGEEECHAVLINLDDQQRKREKEIKKLKKVYKDIPLFIFSNNLDTKKIIKHQNSKIGGSLYLQTPVETEMLKAMLEPFWEDGFSSEDNAILNNLGAITQPQEVFEDVDIDDELSELSSLDDSSAVDGINLNLDTFEEEKEEEEAVHFPDEEDLTFPEMELPEELSLDQTKENENNIKDEPEDEVLDLANNENNLGITMDDGSSDDFVEEVNIGVEVEDLFESSEAIDDELTRPAFNFEKQAPTDDVSEGLDVSSEILDLSDIGSEDSKEEEAFSIDMDNTGSDFQIDDSVEDVLEVEDGDDSDTVDLATKTSIALPEDAMSVDLDFATVEEASAEETIAGLGIDFNLEEEAIDESGEENLVEFSEDNLGEEDLTADNFVDDDISDGSAPILPDLIQDFDEGSELAVNVELNDLEESDSSTDILGDAGLNLEEEPIIVEETVEESVAGIESHDEDATVVFSASSSSMNNEKTATRVNHLGAKTQTTIIQDHKDYVQTHDEELIRLGETIHHLREDRESLLKRIAEIEANKDEQKYDFLNLQALLDEKKIELTVVKKRIESQNEELKTKLDISLDRRAFLEKQNKNFALEIEKLSKQKRMDTSRIHQRERELEEKLEMLRKDAEIQLRNRDQKILELKRRIDSLEFDIETSRAKEMSSVTEQMGLEEKMEGVMKTLRSAIGQLEDDQSEFEKKQTLRKNLK